MTTLSEFNEWLLTMSFQPRGRCGVCRSKPYKWVNQQGHELLLYNDYTWKLYNNGLRRYGHIDTAIEEITDYYQTLVG